MDKKNENEDDDTLVDLEEDLFNDARYVYAQQLQSILNQAVADSVPDGVEPDIGVIVQCLGLISATLATQAGVSEMEFRHAMATYCCQVREAMGLDVKTGGKLFGPKDPDRESLIEMVSGSYTLTEDDKRNN